VLRGDLWEAAKTAYTGGRLGGMRLKVIENIVGFFYGFTFFEK
jgi:hypothetical protein